MGTITFDVDLFRKQFPKFDNKGCYPDESLQMRWDLATCYISDCNYGCLQGQCRQNAINMMTAHLQTLFDNADKGEASGVVTSATIDKVSVSLQPPPANNQTQFQWWLNTTPYGQQLLALLKVKSTGGLFIGGLPETSAFRKVGGVF